MSWCRQNELISEEDQEKWEKHTKRDPSIKMFGVEVRLRKIWTHIGTIGLTSISRVHRTAEFSLFIGPEWQGKGYGRKALLELLRYGFCHMNLHTIWGETFTKNPAMRMFDVLGFTTEGIHRSRYEKNGERIDTYSVSMTRDEYFARYSS